MKKMLEFGGKIAAAMPEWIKCKKKAVSTIEIVLILVVLIGLAYVFKTEIASVADGIYSSITTQVNKF